MVGGFFLFLTPFFIGLRNNNLFLLINYLLLLTRHSNKTKYLEILVINFSQFYHHDLQFVYGGCLRNVSHNVVLFKI